MLAKALQRLNHRRPYCLRSPTPLRHILSEINLILLRRATSQESTHQTPKRSWSLCIANPPKTQKFFMQWRYLSHLILRRLLRRQCSVASEKASFSRHSERRAFLETRQSAKNLLATRASQTLIKLKK